MQIQLKVTKWGNSQAVRLPQQLLAHLGAKEGDQLNIEMHPGGAEIKTAKPSYSLRDLVAQCDLSAPAPKDMDAWNDVTPVGAEV